MAKNNIRQLAVYNDYYARLKEIALSIFKWEGLPETCNERFLEKTLYENGNAIFVNDPVMSFLNLRVNAQSTLNVYEEPTGFNAYSIGYNKYYNSNECVIIHNNYMEKSTDFTIQIFAERLAELELAIRVNTNAQKTPVLVRTQEKNRLTLENIYNQYEGNRPVIFANKQLEDKPIEVLRTDAPFVADKLREEKRAVWNECLEFLGINTNPSDSKRERLVVNEVDANNEQVQIQNDTMLLTREKACEEINKMFGLNVSVKRRLDIDVPEVEEPKEGGADNGEIYD